LHATRKEAVKYLLNEIGEDYEDRFWSSVIGEDIEGSFHSDFDICVYDNVEKTIEAFVLLDTETVFIMMNQLQSAIDDWEAINGPTEY
jgi:hypothetical protein